MKAALEDEIQAATASERADQCCAETGPGTGFGPSVGKVALGHGRGLLLIVHLLRRLLAVVSLRRRRALAVIIGAGRLRLMLLVVGMCCVVRALILIGVCRGVVLLLRVGRRWICRWCRSLGG